MPVLRPVIMLIGADGQVGSSLRRTLTSLGDVQPFTRATLDLQDLDALGDTLERTRPDVIVNGAAYTQVDRAESEQQIAMRINAEAPAVMAKYAGEAGALMVHYSTDYVFDGKGQIPYREDDLAAPGTAYGASKLAGDVAVIESGAEAYIFRVGWVYGGARGNFLRTIQRLAAERPELRIVADQHGSPTWCETIAQTTSLALKSLLDARATQLPSPVPGVYHMAAPDATTWHGFATAIVDAMPADKRPIVRAITTEEFPTPAARPHWSVLNPARLDSVFGLRLPPWREQLAGCLGGGEGTRN